MKHRFLIFLIILITLISNYSYSQEDSVEYFNNNFLRYQDYTYKENIKTVQLYRKGWELSYPIMKLNSSNKLILSFDDIDTEFKDYYYKLIHCDANWNPSDLSEQEYLYGFTENQIFEYDYSFNTTIDYIHYELTIPNKDVRPILSGNYLLKVYEDYDEENLALTKRFYVLKEEVTIEAEANRAVAVDKRNSSQEIDFTIKHYGYRIDDPYTNLKVIVSQNMRMDNAVKDLKPLFIRDKELIYNYEDKNVFDAGSEFRNFDIKSIRYQSEYIKEVKYLNPYYNVLLYNDIIRRFRVYFYDQDLNGKRFINKQEAQNSNTEADYVYVHFTLPMDIPVIDGNIHVFGELTDWNFTNENQMKYNFEEKRYEIRMLLKQGYYNYQYVFVKDGQTKGDVGFIEGNHWETENDYLIFVYNRNFSGRHDELVGVKIINSLRKGGIEMNGPDMKFIIDAIRNNKNNTIPEQR